MKVIIFAVLVVCLASTASSGEVSKKMLKKLARYHLMKSCWGEKNMKDYSKTVKESIKKCQGLTPAFDLGIFEDDEMSSGNQGSFPAGFQRFSGNNNNDLGINNPYEAWMAFLAFQKAQKNGVRRFRRASPPTPAEVAEFRQDLKMFKKEKMQNLANLTCVLADMKVLDANLNINLRYFTQDAYNDLVEPIDPEFQAKLVEASEDCYAIAQSIPQSILDKNPVYKKLGRHMIFFKCTGKAETGLCAKQEISRYYEEKYGPATPEVLKGMGLPEDKFEAAFIGKKVQYSKLSDSEKFVASFLFGGGQKD